eukprot:Lankesteria_metandrocarpae@DN5121_c0_g1_i1.p1
MVGRHRFLLTINNNAPSLELVESGEVTGNKYACVCLREFPKEGKKPYLVVGRSLYLLTVGRMKITLSQPVRISVSDGAPSTREDLRLDYDMSVLRLHNDMSVVRLDKAPDRYRHHPPIMGERIGGQMRTINVQRPRRLSRASPPGGTNKATIQQ